MCPSAAASSAEKSSKHAKHLKQAEDPDPPIRLSHEKDGRDKRNSMIAAATPVWRRYNVRYFGTPSDNDMIVRLGGFQGKTAEKDESCPTQSTILVERLASDSTRTSSDGSNADGNPSECQDRLQEAQAFPSDRSARIVPEGAAERSDLVRSCTKGSADTKGSTGGGEDSADTKGSTGSKGRTQSKVSTESSARAGGLAQEELESLGVSSPSDMKARGAAPATPRAASCSSSSSSSRASSHLRAALGAGSRLLATGSQSSVEHLR